MAPKPKPAGFVFGSCGGVDHPNDHGRPRFGCSGLVTDLPSSMDERALLFGLLGLLLTAAIMLAVAPGAVTWAMSLVE